MKLYIICINIKLFQYILRLINTTLIHFSQPNTTLSKALEPLIKRPVNPQPLSL